VWYFLLLVLSNIMKQYNKHKNCKCCPNFSTDHQTFLADHRLAIAGLEAKMLLRIKLKLEIKSAGASIIGVTWQFISFSVEQRTTSYLGALCSYDVGVGGGAAGTTAPLLFSIRFLTRNQEARSRNMTCTWRHNLRDSNPLMCQVPRLRIYGALSPLLHGSWIRGV
jgi:hypothetical protein